ncbi:transmembrane protein 17 isoform X2 [Ornithorhynchus anatinus]|uniref:transmembrane protein 17 isoform X2 n=1 Tax=Ornithorhynchus anatinus TaxID=9258 RepID=UPI0010A82817|nr:transmembrane protein 17 isoform X2 [Ornithorhynchus anatinus]
MELPAPIRQRLGDFSRTVFNEPNRTRPESTGGSDNEVVSSLPLQMSLYFSVYFFPFWWVCSVIMLQLKVPELAGFWLLSLLLQLPLILFQLFNEGLKILPLERAVHIIFTVFLAFQVIVAFLALKKMVNQLATRFHLRDFDRLDQSSVTRDLVGKERQIQTPGFSRPHLEEFRSTNVDWGSGLQT